MVLARTISPIIFCVEYKLFVVINGVLTEVFDCNVFVNVFPVTVNVAVLTEEFACRTFTNAVPVTVNVAVLTEEFACRTFANTVPTIPTFAPKEPCPLTFNVSVFELF